MKLAVDEEAMIAKSKGHVHPADGVPYTTVGRCGWLLEQTFI